VLFIDLDNFKRINDLHGHTVGDTVLCRVAKRLAHCFPNELKVRQGGDEFIVLSNRPFDSKLEAHCRRFLEELARPIQGGGHEFSIRASIGVATAPQHGSGLDELLRRADMAMYEAKRLHTGVFHYTDQLEARNERTEMIERALQGALDRNEFHLAYQPQVNARDHSVIGFEALLRWRHPELGMVPPDQFIPVAETMGLMRDLGRFVVRTALREIPPLLRKSSLQKKTRIAVNVSASRLFDERFLKELETHCHRFTTAGLELVVEITESIFIEDMDLARRLLEGLRKAGIVISLDDFGTGYSSLSTLSKLPISELKIDKGFVRHIASDSRDHRLILSIIGLGRGLGIPVLAEGVETERQVEMLINSGCERFQGYYFSPPLAPDALADFLSRPIPCGGTLVD